MIAVPTIRPFAIALEDGRRHRFDSLLFANIAQMAKYATLSEDGRVGVISFAFVCHHNSLLIYGSLRTPTMDRFARVTHYSTAISMVACLSMALGGYVTFGDMTKGNVLNNFPTDNIMVNIARLCFGLNMITTLPLECFVCRGEDPDCRTCKGTGWIEILGAGMVDPNVFGYVRESGYDPEDPVDRAVMATREAAFPLHGLDVWFD